MPEDQQVNRRLTRIEDQIDAILSQLSRDKKEKPSTVKQVQDIVALVATALAAVAATAFIFYAFGYVIVNSYLSSYGVKVSELTNPAYIPAGLAFVFVNLLIPSVAVGLSRGYPRPHLSRIKNALAPALITFSFILIFTYLFLYLAKLESLSILLYPLLSAIFFTFMMAQARDIWSRYDRMESALFTGLIVAALAIVLLVYWSRTVYPDLMPAFGGGKPMSVQFSISDPANEQQFRAIGINIDSNLHVTEPVKFLVETNDALLVLLPNGSAARIDKKLVTNFRYTSPITTSTGSLTPTVPISVTPTITTPVQITPSP